MAITDHRPAPHGRGSAIEPPNRFLKAHAVPDYADFENDLEFLAELRRVPTEFLDDASQSIVSENDSPDVPFRYSVNPYRGCERISLEAVGDYDTSSMVESHGIQHCSDTHASTSTP